MSEILSPQNSSLQLRCAPVTPFVATQFWLVVVVGGTISLVSLVENAFLFVVFVTTATLRNSYLLLACLSMVDSVLATTYIFLFSGRTAAEYFQSSYLDYAWHLYVIPVFTLSHMLKLMSTCLIVFATFERFRGTQTLLQFPFSRRKRIVLIVLSFLIGFSLKVSIGLEYVVSVSPECEGLYGHLNLNVSSLLLENYWYSHLWAYWIRNVLVIFVPFIAIIVMNGKIISSLRKQHLNLMGVAIFRNFAQSLATQREKRIRSTTKMLLGISGSYLAANSLNVIIATWEYLNFESLKRWHEAFYLLGGDIVSLLTLLSTALRLPIYWWCNDEIRKRIRELRNIPTHLKSGRNTSLDEGPRRKVGLHAEARLELLVEGLLQEHSDGLVFSSKHGKVVVTAHSDLQNNVTEFRESFQNGNIYSSNGYSQTDPETAAQ